MKDIKAIFDIGNDSIKAVVFADDEGKNTILAKHIEPAQGIRKGKILDSEAFTRSINNITENFIKKLGGDFIDEVFVGISHPESIVRRIAEQKRVMQDEINENDVEHLSKVITDIAVQNNMETIKIVPVYRIIDEEKKEKDPIGLKGKRLELVADAFMVPKNLYNGVMEAFDNVGLSIADVVPNILSSTEIILDYDRRDLGTVLIDIGKNQTTYTIYEEGYPLGYGTIPIGGEDVTKDISIGMQIDIKEAEDIKKSHGTAIVDKNISEDSPLDIHFLTEIISSRYEEIFGRINKHLEHLDRDGRLPGGIILIGGGSKMPNLDLLSKDTFKLATFYGKDNQLHLGDISNNIQFTNVLGTFIRSNKYTEGRKGSGIKINLDIIGGVKKFFKELF
ncbi:MAG TPA: cell division protein FtsA [Candidatus Absconditabacterales bacterium]|nr:cell division protein FtsA [Candidatus Absconditabacterales bacterium]